MKTSCVRHPAQRSYLMIHQWQLDYCEGDHTTAALLSFFEGWHNTNLANIEQHQQLAAYLEKTGQKAHLPEPNLYIPRTEQQLIEGVLKACKSPGKIRKSVQFLKEKGVISTHKNPKDGFDRMNYYLFHPNIINQWLDQHYSEPTPPAPKINPAQRQGDFNHHTPISPATIEKDTQTTTKVTETNTLEKPCSACGASMVQRQNKAGESFWGCTHYPKCKHTESVIHNKPPPKPPPHSITKRAVTLYDKEGQYLRTQVLSEDHIKQLPEHRSAKGQLLGYRASG